MVGVLCPGPLAGWCEPEAWQQRVAGGPEWWLWLWLQQPWLLPWLP